MYHLSKPRARDAAVRCSYAARFMQVAIWTSMFVMRRNHTRGHCAQLAAPGPGSSTRSTTRAPQAALLASLQRF